MATVFLQNSHFIWPQPLGIATWTTDAGRSAISFTAATIDAPTDKVHFVGYLRWSDGSSGKIIKRVHFYTGGNSTVPSPDMTLGVTIEGVQENPTKGNGVVYTGASGSVSSIVDGAVSTAEFASPSVAQPVDVPIAVVIAVSSYVEGSIGVCCMKTHARPGTPQVVMNNSNSLAAVPMVLFESTTGDYGTLDGATFGFTSDYNLVGNGATTRIGTTVKVPFACNARGVYWRGDGVSSANATGLTVYFGTYGSGTLTATQTLVLADHQFAYGSSGGWNYVPFASPVSLSANTDYAVVLYATDTSPEAYAIRLETVTYENASHKYILPGSTNTTGLTSADGATYTESSTVILSAGVVIDSIETASSSGGYTPTLSNFGTIGF
jgi:hypothetical protein